MWRIDWESLTIFQIGYKEIEQGDYILISWEEIINIILAETKSF